jgi:putative transposase
VGRRLRYVEEGGGLVEVTARMLQRRFLLRPSQVVNEIVIGLLARGKRRYGVEVCLFVFLSNHFHLLLKVENAYQLSQFMGWFNSNLAREVARLTGWTGKVFDRRYTHVLVSDEEAAQVDRLHYFLAHGAKENLVASPLDWPGVHCAQGILSEEPIEGFWFDRTREGVARRRGEDLGPRDFAEREVLEWDLLPCWAHLSQDEYRQRVRDAVEEIEAKTAARIRATGITPIGRAAILAQRPEDRPNRSKKSPAPLFHAFRKSVRQEMWEAYSLFVAAFREAAERLKNGHPRPGFPEGSFPPGAPFVGIPLPVTA